MDDQPQQPQQQRQTSRSERGQADHGPSVPSGIEHQCVELCPICRTADVLRASLPPEFHEHWQAFQREAMLALRKALDHYIAHLEAEHDGEPPIEDIPIG